MDSLADIAEVCIYDNGSDDNPSEVIDASDFLIPIKYERGEHRAPIDHSWLTALSLGSGAFKKLQLADDQIHPENVRAGLQALIEEPEKSYILSPTEIGIEGDSPENLNLQMDYNRRSNILREKIGNLTSLRERSNFVFSELCFGNTLGDINGLIFRSDSLDGMSATSQSYYGFITHPDAEIFLYLLANHIGSFYHKPFSIYVSSTESPTNRIQKDARFNLRVYRIPAITHAIALFMDPGFYPLRNNADYVVFWRFFIRFTRRFFREIAQLRKEPA